ncbi:transglycosylase domain-containing protein [Paenibacillus cisolokensis]|uniref:transglycosylase domain-containing protein n=1 Tax=Paenibacillus cisolokensis TaxID=1658519 RepID=UPI003D2AEBCB
MNENDRQQEPRKRSKWRTFFLVVFISVKWLVIFLIMIGLLAGGAVTGYVAALVKDDEIRPRTLIEQKVNENGLTGFVYFSDGSVIGQLVSEEDRRLVTYEEIPQHVIDALLATEDNNFWNHYGVDINGLGRAVKQKLLNEDQQTGGSTITQQLARRLFLSADRTDSRKFKEILLSLRMERYLTKPEILTAYLNKMPFGNGSNGYNVSGIKAAAKGIFNISDLSQLNLAQAAYLAGLPQRPSAYSAFTGKGEFNEENFGYAMERQRHVLSRMLETGRITQAEYEEAKAFDIRASLAKPSPKAYAKYPYLMFEAQRAAAEILLKQKNPELTEADLRNNPALVEEARQELLSSGYRVYTTIDKKIYSLMKKIAEDKNNFTPDSKEKGMEQIAAVMINHKTGAIISMLEGRDFYEEQMNLATQMIRQPGSTMKPIAAYLPALEEGLIQPAGVLDDSPIILKDGGKGYHIPMNAGRNFRGLVTAREALDRSLNIPAIKLFVEKVTIKKSWDFVRKLGITTLHPDDDYAQTGVIGGLHSGTTVEELTNAYGTIPNGGIFNDAYMISQITDSEGNVVYRHKAEPRRVFSEQTAFLMTDMLRTVIANERGTAHDLTGLFDKYGTIPIAGKTGSTQNYADVWFMGFTPDITLGVWAGYEQQIHTLSDNGKKRARHIWAKIMNETVKEKPTLFKTESFARPDGVVKATVSSVSGKLPTDLTRQAGLLTTDWFNEKYLPKEPDDALVKFKYISYNGVNYLPNPATPEDMVSEKIGIKREKPLDQLMDEIRAAQEKMPASSRRPLGQYVPRDADSGAPSKIDPRKDDGAVPSPPPNVRLVTEGNTVTIGFSASGESDVVGYRLYRSVGTNAFQKIGPSILTGQTYRFTDTIAPNTAYRYYVTAVDVVGKESAPSAIVQIVPEAPPVPVIPVPDPAEPAVPDAGTAVPDNVQAPTSVPDAIQGGEQPATESMPEQTAAP